MLSCKQLVLSDFLDGQLTLRERFAVRTHLAMCINCVLFANCVLPNGSCSNCEVEISGLDALAERLARAAESQKNARKADDMGVAGVDDLHQCTSGIRLKPLVFQLPGKVPLSQNLYICATELK